MANVSRRLCSLGWTFCHRRTKPWQILQEHVEQHPLARSLKGQKSRVYLVTTTCQLPQVAARGFSSSASAETPMRDEVTVVYQRGMPVITIPLPSRRERCRFTLRPVSSTVGNFIEDVQREDRGIDRIIIETTDGVRIASSTNIESLMQEDFHIVINHLTYFVSPPETGRITSEEIQKLSDVKAHVAKLYEVLQVGEHQLEQERQLYTELEELKKKLEPMEKKKESLIAAANKRTNYMVWVGLTMMGVQFGVLARLTWWEYSWDIMEPVTYFITYGTTMAMYGYYVLTRQEYYLPAVRDRQFLFAFHKRAQKGGLDVQEYNHLKDEVARVESELKRLRDPLQLHLPIKELTQHDSKMST